MDFTFEDEMLYTRVLSVTPSILTRTLFIYCIIGLHYFCGRGDGRVQRIFIVIFKPAKHILYKYSLYDNALSFATLQPTSAKHGQDIKLL